MSSARFTGTLDLRPLLNGSADSSRPIELSTPGAVAHCTPELTCVISGTPRFADPVLQALLSRDGLGPALSQAWRQHGERLPSLLQGGFALVIIDQAKRKLLLAVDRFAVQTLCHAREGDLIHFSDRADTVAVADRQLDRQSIFDYLYFHMIPAPRTVYRAVQRLPMAQACVIDAEGTRFFEHRAPQFKPQRLDFVSAQQQFMGLIEQSVQREIEGQAKVGAFLSGGTDSSTVAGMLCKLTGKAAPVYSIGFEAAGYDEMSYARLAAKHFGCEHHEYYLTPDDLARALPEVAQFHDQPFGNSSALPAYLCARIAHDDGCTRLLAGDGGDELFGGNSRYAMQQFLQHYHSLPEALRQRIEPYCSVDSPLRRIPGLRQLTGYARHASPPLPDRLQTMNLLMVLGPDTVLTSAMMVGLDTEAPLKHMRGTWAASAGASVLNRMLAYDWRYTLADSDLPKVRGATDMAAIAVGYPLLSDELTDFSLALPDDWKLRRFKLRWFFKRALKDFLPPEIIAKKKHGFGLPFGVWMAQHPGLSKLAHASLEQLADRDVVQRAFVRRLLDEQMRDAPGYYGEMVWLLLSLELWLQGHAPDFQARR